MRSNVKFPPHFDNTWILGGFGNGKVGGLWVTRLDTSTLKPTLPILRLDPEYFPVPVNFLQALYGQDGALYILNYSGVNGEDTNPGIRRVTYTGSCLVASTGDSPAAAPYQSIWWTGNTLVVAERGDHEVAWHAHDGRLVQRISGTGRAEYRLSGMQGRLGLPRGVYLVKVKTGRGFFTRALSLL